MGDTRGDDVRRWYVVFSIHRTRSRTGALRSVLATHNKEKGQGPKKGKGAEIARWEAELRQSLANKKTKASSAGLSKEAHALVQAQLVKEAAIRERVGALRVRLVRALAFVRSIVRAGGAGIKPFVQPVAERLLEGATSRMCARLIDGGEDGVGPGAEDGPFETFVSLTRCLSERLEGLRRWVGVAVLRALEVGCIPEEQAAEALGCAYIPSCRFHIRFERMRQQRWCSACSTGSGRSLNKRRWTRPRFRSRSCCSGVLHARVGSALNRVGAEAGIGIQMGRRGSSRSSSCWT